MPKLALELAKTSENTSEQARIRQTTQLKAGAQGLQAKLRTHFAGFRYLR